MLTDSGVVVGQHLNPFTETHADIKFSQPYLKASRSEASERLA